MLDSILYNVMLDVYTMNNIGELFNENLKNAKLKLEYLRSEFSKYIDVSPKIAETADSKSLTTEDAFKMYNELYNKKFPKTMEEIKLYNKLYAKQFPKTL